MAYFFHRLVLELEFPEGVSAGEESRGNRLFLAKDGLGRFVLRATALAGALRHAWAKTEGVLPDDPEVTKWFGVANDDDAGLASPLRISDCVIETGKEESNTRIHNSINRHTGSVLSGGLFEIESLPPGASGMVVLRLKTEDENAADFLAWIANKLDGGMILGGRKARGLGRVQLKTSPLYSRFDPQNVDQLAAWLDEQYNLGKCVFPEACQPLPETKQGETVLTVRLKLAVPRGQDVLPGDGQGLDYELQPRQIRDVDGKSRFCIPGSALKGIFRSWISRLAARDGFDVADSFEKHRLCMEQQGELSGDDLAWGFVKDLNERERYQQNPDLIECPIMKLFGSSYMASRFHIADAFAEDGATENVRMHVAIDRFSGGANEGMLFDNTVLTGAKFNVVITVANPTQREVDWIGRTIKAIDMGLVRIGSSKSAGRLGLNGSPRAEGPFSEKLNSIRAMEG